MNRFEISIDQWLAREQGDDIARATLAQLELRSGDRPLTLLEDRHARTNRTVANLSAYDLALWLVANWWRLRWEPERQGDEWRMAHSLAAIGGGFVWPNVTVLSDGEQVLIQARPSAGQAWEPIRYMDSWDSILSAEEFEWAVDSFVERVLARLAGCRISATGLHQLWGELRSERANPETASIRKLEALLGFDAAAAPDDLIDELLAGAEEEGRTAVDEIVAGFGRRAPEIVRQVDESLSQHGTQLDSASLRDLTRCNDTWTFSGPPWERGERAAQVAREVWKLDGQPVGNNDLSRLLGVDRNLITEKSPAEMAPMPAGRWLTPDHSRWRVVLRSRWEVGRRFELCRLIGDSLIAPEGETLLPSTPAKTSRQKFQRAFAQEFLCPSEVLRERLGSLPPEDEDIESAARYFEVSPLLVRSKLANLGVLPRF